MDFVDRLIELMQEKTLSATELSKILDFASPKLLKIVTFLATVWTSGWIIIRNQIWKVF